MAQTNSRAYKIGLAIASIIGVFLGSFTFASALSTYATVQGGTGTTSPSGILYGDNGSTSHLNTVSIGSNLTFSGGTLSATGGGSTTGLATTSPVSAGNLLVYSATGAGSAFGVATGTISQGTGITVSSGQSVIGSGLTITNSSPLSGLTAGYPYSFSNPTLTWLGLSTTTNSGMAAGNLYVGSGGIFQTAASSSIFGYTPLNPTRNINTTFPLTGGGNLTSDLTLASSFSTTTNTGLSQGNLYIGSGGIMQTSASSTFFGALGTPGQVLMSSNGSVVWAATSTGGGGSVTSVTATAPVFSSGGNTPNITWYGLSTTSQPTSSQLLTSNGVNGVYGTGTSTLSASSPLTGSFTQVGSGGSLGIQAGGTSQNGYISSTDWNTFNNKIGWGQATSTSANQIVYTNANGLLVSTASSTLFSPTTPGFVWGYANGAWGPIATSSTAGGATTPGGSIGQLQWNSNSTFAGIATTTTGVASDIVSLNASQNTTIPFASTTDLTIGGFTISTTTTVCLFPQKCDYVATSSNADFVINQALNFVGNSGGGAVHIKSGLYVLVGTLNPLSNTLIYGDGPSTIIQTGNSSSGKYGVDIYGSGSNINNVTIENMAFDGTQQNGTGSARAISIGTSGVATVSNIQILNNYFTNIYGFAIFVSSAFSGSTGAVTTGVLIQGNTMNCHSGQDCIGGGPNELGQQSTTTQVTIANNTITKDTVGSSDYSCINATSINGENIQGNTCTGIIRLDGSQAPNINDNISNNILYPIGTTVAAQIVVSDDQDTTQFQSGHINIANNVLNNGDIYLNGNSGTLTNFLNVTGNNITMPGGRYTTQFGNINYGIYGNNITDSTISNNTIATSSAISSQGVYLNSGSTNNTVIGNTISGANIGVNTNSGAGNYSELNTYVSDVVNESGVVNTLNFNNGLLGIGTSTPWGSISASSTSAFPTLAIQQKGTGSAAIFTGGNVGIGTTTPGSLLSVSGIVNFTSATSTFYANGLNLTNGCYAIGNTCIGTINSLTTNGTSGAATFSGGVLNIPQYTSGGSSFAYLFPNQLGGGNATSSLVGFSGGILDTASSTVVQTTFASGGTVGISSSTPWTTLGVAGNGTISSTGTVFLNTSGSGSSIIGGASEANPINNEFIHDPSGNGFIGLWNTGNNRAYGIEGNGPCANLSTGQSTSCFFGYYYGMGAGGGTNSGMNPIFGVLNSTEAQNGIGNVALTVYANNAIQDYYNVLDDGTGKIGIGTTTPFANLSLQIGGTNGGGGSLAPTTPFIIASSSAGTATTTLFSVNSTGQVTIASTTAISGSLTYGGVQLLNSVTGTGSMVLSAAPALTGTVQAGSIKAGTGANSQLTLEGSSSVTPSTSNVLIEASNGATFTATIPSGSLEVSSSTVGIGTTTPLAQFAISANSVNGIGGQYGQAPIYLLLISSSTLGTATSTLFTIGNTGSTTIWKMGACNGTGTGIGTQSSGLLYCETGISDQRMKKDIVSLPDALSVIEGLNPVSFYWKDPSLPNTGGQTGQQYGFIAQDVQKVLPNLVGKTNPTYLTPDGTFTLNQQGIIPWLVQAVKEQEVQIEAKGGAPMKDAEDNWQWGAIALLAVWNIYLTVRKRK